MSFFVTAMSRTQHQQLFNILQQSKSPLITFKKDSSGDVIASSLALNKIFKKLGLNSEIVSPNFELPDNFRFLPDAMNIKQNLLSPKKMTIILDHPSIKSHNLKYQETSEQLHIHISPQSSEFSKEHIKISENNFTHDLIIALNTPDLNSLDFVYEQNADFFYEIPIVNIDYSPENEHYGQINIINITATSVSEIIYDFIQEFGTDLIDEQIATNLLAGMIEKTKSFKLPTITPKSLNIASQLMAAGAERDNIIKNLYQTRSVNTLRLWGKTLLKLQTNSRQSLAWAEISDQDFNETQTNEKDLYGVIDELISNIPTVELSAIFFTKQNLHFALIKSEKGLDLKNQFINYNPEGYKSLVKFSHANNSQEILDQLQTII